MHEVGRRVQVAVAKTYAEVVEAIVELGMVLFGIGVFGGWKGLASRYNRAGSELSKILISRDLENGSEVGELDGGEEREEIEYGLHLSSS